MAQLTLQQLVSFVQDFQPDCPQAKIVRKLNVVLQDVHERLALPLRSTFTTKAKTTTGTVAATNGSTSVTFSSSVLLTTDPLRIVRISGDGTWYTLTRVSGTSGTLSSEFAGETGAALTFEIVYPCVTYPTGVGQITRVWREGSPDLAWASDENGPGRTLAPVIGIPAWRAPFQWDATGTPDDLLREILIPAPEQAISYTYAYLPRVPFIEDAAATSTVLTVPQHWSRALQWGTLAGVVAQQDGPASAMPHEAKYEQAILQARSYMNTGRTSQSRSVDESRNFRVSAWQYPPGSS